MFDLAYFSGIFAERVRAFSHDHDDARARVRIATPDGLVHDAVQLRASQTSATVLTRDSRLLFIPYERIAYVEVSVLNDRRLADFELLVDA